MSARYCKKNKERFQKKACERYQDLSAEEKIKTENMVANNIKIFQSMINQG